MMTPEDLRLMRVGERIARLGLVRTMLAVLRGSLGIDAEDDPEVVLVLRQADGVLDDADYYLRRVIGGGH